MYALLFLGTFLEGPVVMMSAGFLFRLGQFSFWPMYLALVAGDFAADLCWYFVGLLVARRLILRWGYWLNITPEAIAKIEKVFKNYDSWILAISKLTMGFGLALATLTTAGMLRVSLVRYAVINLVCGLIWTLFLVIIGYFFGNLYQYIPSQLQIAFVIAMLTVWVFSLRYAAKRFAAIDWQDR